MAKYKIPVFEHGSILSQEMLERLREYAIELWNIQTGGFSDGILKGCGITVKEHVIYIGQGIFIFEGQVYFIHEEMKVPYFPENKWRALKIRIGEREKSNSFYIQEIEPVITEDLERRKGEIEIGRFRLQSGATLRSEYRNFQDVATEFDTLNLIHAQWAGYGKDTVSYEMLRFFAKEAIQKNIQNPDDFTFVEQILLTDGRSLNRAAIELYISKRLSKPMKDMTNEEIYRGLCEILRIFHSGGGGMQSRIRERRMIVE